MTDVMFLGPVIFTDFSKPGPLQFGGRQAMAMHKLPGGARVIDTLGQDDMDLTWSGRFYQSDAYDTCLLLDALRRAGTALPLVFGGQYFTVVIADFRSEIVRLPHLMNYSITCVVQDSFNVIGAIVSAVDSLIGPDINAALAF